MNSIFISYAYNDYLARNIVDMISLSLQDNETIIYPNDKMYEYGNDLSQQIMDIINKCNYIICIWESSNPNIMFELGYALGKNKNIIIIGDYNDIPYNLKDFNYIRRSDNINEILMELNKRLFKQTDNQRYYYSSRNYKELLNRAVLEQGILDNLNTREFEEIIFEYLENQNLNVETVSPYYGCDFIIRNYNCLVEVKKYGKNSKISLTSIRAMLGTMVEMNIDRAIIISTSEFTPSAINFVKSLNQQIILLTLEELIKLDGKFDSIF